MKQWEIIADNLHDAGFSLGWVALWIAKDGRSGLLTRTAMMEGVSSSAPMKFSVRLLNWSVGYFPAGVHVIVPQVEVTREIQPLPWKKTEVILEM